MNASFAQIRERIQERLKEQTEKKVEEKVLEKAGQQPDENQDGLNDRKRPGRVNSFTSPSDSTRKSAPQMGMFASMQNAKYEPSYTLKQELKVEMKSQEKKNKKVEVMNMRMSYGETCFMNVLESEDKKDQSKSLIDFTNNTSIVLNDKDMSAVAISLDYMSNMVQQSAENNKDSISTDESFTFTRTGNTKMIAGYMCEEVIMESDDMKINAWYTDDIKIDMYKGLSQSPFFVSFSKGTPEMSEEMTGTLMESHMQEKTGDQGTFDYLVKEVIIGDTIIDLSKYTFTTFGQ